MTAGALRVSSYKESVLFKGVDRVIQGDEYTLSEVEAGVLLLLFEHPVITKIPNPDATAARKKIFAVLTNCNFKGETY